MLFIGIDLGTSAVKLLLMDENGSIHKTVSKEYPLYFPQPGWAEQDPEDWLAQTVEGIKELTSDCEKARIRGISFGGQNREKGSFEIYRKYRLRGLHRAQNPLDEGK